MNDETEPSLDLPPCPFLPVPEGILTAASVQALGEDRGPDFYLAALNYAQSLWLQGFPARAILLMNRAMGCGLEGREPVLMQWPLPYFGMVWLLRNCRPEQFIGNPRRHWQHLATRMSGPRAELRTWRAWACWRIACIVRPDDPADEKQIAEEDVREPGEETIADRLTLLGHPGEVVLWREALEYAGEDP
ncbi:MAG: hypothetical protein JWM59_4046 [Verrucomicrobiales bacterium]|nr:hypothetical protein [Verrucomicrobiales bacterium]